MNFQNIEGFETGSTLVLTIKGDDGSDLTSRASITWYDTDGKEIGTGNSLNGIESGAELYYSVELEEELGRVCREVKMQKVTVNGEAVTCVLEKIGRISLQGRLSATDIDKNPAKVAVRQLLNGKWEQTFSTQTNEQGVFAVEVYDDVTDITVSGDGYLSTTLHRDGFGGNGNVGTIPLNLISGFVVAADIEMQPAAAQGETAVATAWDDGLNNIEFTLSNQTRGTALSDIAVQDGSVIIKTGATVGDVIRVEAKSKQGVFADASTTFTLADGANGFCLHLEELGGLDATCTASNNGSTAGYLYDSSNRLVARGNYVGDALSLRHLPSGTYTLVSMGMSRLLGNMTHLNNLTATGLTAGNDYVSTRVTVADGIVSTVAVGDVPQLDETTFYYTSTQTYFNANRSSVTAGNYLTLMAHMDFKEEHATKVDNVTLTIDLPEGCRMVENSVIANGQVVPHTLNGNRLTIPLTKEQWQSQVRFCVIPTQNKSYTLTALASFDAGGQVQQPIGSAQFETKGLSIGVPTQVAATQLTVNGAAIGKSEVKVYDNDVLIGQATAKSDGSWTAACELYKPYNYSFHDIYAKVSTPDGLELSSETKQVLYDKNSIVPSKVTMTFYNGWYKKNINVEFDQQTGETTPSSYPFYTATDFTFLADFTRNDEALIKNVNIKVLNSDGTIRTLPATFDPEQGRWVATTRYSSTNKLPRNATVEYDVMPLTEEISHEEGLYDEATIMANSVSRIHEYIQDHVGLTLLEETEYSLLFKYHIDETGTDYLYRIEEIDFAEAEQMMAEKQFIYAETEEGGIGTYTEVNGGNITTVCVDLAQSFAMRVTLSNPNGDMGRKEIPIKSAINNLKASFSNGKFLKNLGVLADIAGIAQYWSVRSDFANLCDLITRYTDNYNTMRSCTVKMMLAKCPDGSPKLSEGTVNGFNDKLKDLSEEEGTFSDQYYQFLEEYQKRLFKSVATDVATMGIGLAIGVVAKTTKFVSTKFSKWFLKQLSVNTTAETAAEILGNTTGTVLSAIVEIDKVFKYKDFTGTRDKVLLWAPEQNQKIVQGYLNLRQSITDSYKKCEKEKNKDKDNSQDEENDGSTDFPTGGTQEIIDPSGYVYEAVTSNRLEGVTVTCYQKVQTEDMYGDLQEEIVLWNAEEYSQQNPLRTDEAGFYRWDVPMGLWQVKCEKEGYETAYSEWLPVPPPQLDVNVGMRQSTPPTVTRMRGAESGITIDLSKYMRPETMTTTHITVTRNGSAEKGRVEMLNAEEAPLGGETYVQRVKFVPESRFHLTDNVVVTVGKDVESYCGVTMTKDHVETVKIEPEITAIVVDSLVSVAYRGTRDLQVVVLPKDASAGRTLHVKTSSAMIASVSSSDVAIDQNGMARLTLSGQLPGGAVLDFSVDGTDMTGTTKVRVVMDREAAAMPVANIVSGTTIEGGTQIVLSCDTEGATIYYTLDGSCPCDEATRHRYDGPITVVSDVIVKAIAVKDGMDDSDVATFVYILNGIASVSANHALTAAYAQGSLTIQGAEGGSVRVFDQQGRELAYRQKAQGRVVLSVAKAECYVVCVTYSDGQTVVRKVAGW